MAPDALARSRRIGWATLPNGRLRARGQRQQADAEAHLAVVVAPDQVVLGQGRDQPVDDRPTDIERLGELADATCPAGPADGQLLQHPDAAVERLRGLTAEGHVAIPPDAARSVTPSTLASAGSQPVASSISTSRKTP